MKLSKFPSLKDKSISAKKAFEKFKRKCLNKNQSEK